MVTDCKGFRSSIIKLGLPIAFQDLISAGLGLLDAIILSRLGETQLAAVGLAGQITFLTTIILYGLGSGSTVLLSQFRGKSDTSGIRAVTNLTLGAGLLVTVPFMLMALLLPGSLMSLFTDDAKTIHQGADYLRITALSFPLYALSTTLTAHLRSRGRTMGPAAVSCAVLVSNTYLTLALGLGVGPSPALGVAGAAMALTMSRVIELVCLMRLAYGRDGLSAQGDRAAETVNAPAGVGIREYLAVVWPVVASEGLWAAASVVLMGIYARLGTGATVAYHIACTVQGLILVGAVGLSNSCAIIIGRKIGEGSPDEAKLVARASLNMAWWLGAGLCGLMYASAPGISTLFGVSEEARLLSVQALRVTSAVSFLACADYVLNMGVLRGGGDTRWSLAVDMGLLWALGIPLAAIGALVLKLPLPWCMSLASAEMAVKVLMGVGRVRSGRWVHDLTAVEREAEHAA